ncbi:MAG: hypothetical protein JXA71_05185 [Chitinispirillaceae bacterium]|nr:hypothetical protein [Chitinispirillaceae bacterium]
MKKTVSMGAPFATPTINGQNTLSGRTVKRQPVTPKNEIHGVHVKAGPFVFSQSEAILPALKRERQSQNYQITDDFRVVTQPVVDAWQRESSSGVAPHPLLFLPPFSPGLTPYSGYIFTRNRCIIPSD